MNFAPGDEVICVDVLPHSELQPPGHSKYDIPEFLQVGSRYIVDWVGDYRGRRAIQLAGIRRPADVPFLASRFRPVRRESIEQLKQFAADIGRKQTTPERHSASHHGSGHLAGEVVGPFIQIGGPHPDSACPPASTEAAGPGYSPFRHRQPSHSVDGAI